MRSNITVELSDTNRRSIYISSGFAHGFSCLKRRGICDFCAFTRNDAGIRLKRPYRKREVMVPWNKGENVPGWSPKVSLEEGIKQIS